VRYKVKKGTVIEREKGGPLSAAGDSIVDLEKHGCTAKDIKAALEQGGVQKYEEDTTAKSTKADAADTADTANRAKG